VTAHLSGAILRALLALGLTGAGIGAYAIMRTLVLARARAALRGLSGFTRGTAAVVAFSTPECVTCRAAQKPALRSLGSRLGAALQIIEVDAAEQPALARAWGVLSVPTTFVLDGEGRPREVNHGFASAEKLMGQVRQATTGQRRGAPAADQI
jgi:hypothetical protein